jgi:GntR family transcriptional regulator of abcA and norABC
MYKKYPDVSRTEHIADKIKEYVAEKKIEADEQLPSVRDFTKMFFSSIETVSGALELLSIAGLVRIKPNIGIFVIKDSFTDFNAKVDWEQVKSRSTLFYSDPRIHQLVSPKETDKDSIYLSWGQINDTGLSEILYNEMGKLGKLAANFSDYDLTLAAYGQGLPELRETLSEHMASYGISASPEQIIITRTFRDTAMILSNLLTAKGSGIFYDEPGSLSFHTYLRTLGGKMCGIGMDKHGPVVSELVNAVKANKNSIFYTIPLYVYPTGITTSKIRKSEVLKIAVNANMPIVELDIYRELDKTAPIPYYALDRTSGVIYVGTFNSVLPLGFGISWVVAPRKILEMLKDLQYQYDWTVSVNDQLFMNEILLNGVYLKYLDALRIYLKQRTDFADMVLEKHLKGLVKIRGLHPTVYWLELPFAAKNLLLPNSGLNISTGELFSKNHPNFIAISKVQPKMDKYEEGIISLKKLICSFM